jgi:hypothetical protein
MHKLTAGEAGVAKKPWPPYVEVMRIYHQHRWGEDYADEVDPKVVRLALKYPEKAGKKWK